MVEWTIFLVIKSIFYSCVHCNWDMLLHVFKFINKDSFLNYKLQHELSAIDCYANELI
jgi:hypothetical protein